jgi:hypothetical protein
MELEGSLLCLKELVTGLYPEPDESSPQPAILFFMLHFNIILPPTCRSSKRYLSFMFPNQNPF